MSKIRVLHNPGVGAGALGGASIGHNDTEGIRMIGDYGPGNRAEARRTFWKLCMAAALSDGRSASVAAEEADQAQKAYDARFKAAEDEELRKRRERIKAQREHMRRVPLPGPLEDLEDDDGEVIA